MASIFSCIPTICFLGIHHRQLHYQLSSCWLVCHREGMLMDRLHCLKTGYFCFSLKCWFNITNFLQSVQQALTEWFCWPLTRRQLSLSWMDTCERKGNILCQLSSSLHMDLERNQRGKWNGQMGRSGRVLCGQNAKICTFRRWTGGHCKFQNDEVGHGRRMLRMLGKSKCRIHKTESTFAWSSKLRFMYGIWNTQRTLMIEAEFKWRVYRNTCEIC